MENTYEIYINQNEADRYIKEILKRSEKNELKENKELVLFENKKIRRQEYQEEWYYSVIMEKTKTKIKRRRF